MLRMKKETRVTKKTSVDSSPLLLCIRTKNGSSAMLLLSLNKVTGGQKILVPLLVIDPVKINNTMMILV